MHIYQEKYILVCDHACNHLVSLFWPMGILMLEKHLVMLTAPAAKRMHNLWFFCQMKILSSIAEVR